jgi:YidC/Oxa1 family membrane protein insertase
MMKFYRENEVNPFASCLPLVAQLPVFISLFYMLRKNLRTDICPAIQRTFQKHYAAVHHVSLHTALSQTTQCGDHVTAAGFLFIKDITNQAHGVTLVVLMLLYVGTQLFSTMLMATPTMDRSQRNLMMIMPIAFVIFIIRFPAGLIVYWVTTNAWTMAQQFTLKKLMGPPPPAAVVAAAEIAGPSPRGGGRGGGGAPAKRSGGGGGSNGGGSPAGAGSGGSLGRVLRGIGGGSRTAAVDPEPASGRAGGSGPPPPRKKRKRSGRRR